MVAPSGMTPGSPQEPGRKSHGASEYLRGLALLAWVSWEIIALTGLGIGVGWALNRWLNAPILLAAVFGVLGLVLAFYRIYRASQRLGGDS